MTTTRRHARSDPVRFGKLVVDIATRQTLDAEHDGNDAAAAELRRKGGAKRAAKPAATERSERIFTNSTWIT
jgi:hypothetical protein